LLLAAGAAVVVVADPFGAGSSGGAVDNASATSLATVTRRSLSSQTLVDGTLGYAGSATIVVPSGTAPADVRKAQQAVAAARATLEAALATLATDEQTLADAQAKLVADRRKLTGVCAGDNAAGNGSGGNDSSGSGSSPCATAATAVTSDEQAVATDLQKVMTDAASLESARAGVSAAEESVRAAAAETTAYDAGAAYTMLPAAGTIVHRGQPLYAVDGHPVLLLYGSVTAWRSFRPGMSPGRDVAELNANLRALGYDIGASGDRFTAATERAIAALQAARGLPRTGALLLGSVAFEPGAVRVTSVTPTLGETVQPGPVLGITSTRRQVTIALDAAQQSNVKVGDPVTITLPDNSTTPGRVSYVGTVATVPSSSNGDQGNGSTTPTIEVDVAPTVPAATGHLDQAPVNVSITTGSVRNALVVPVNALLALASGGYAVEVSAGGVHRLVAVQPGLFDDADGMVQVTGSGLAAGQRVVVPSQ
jgi:hypothetical protein